MTDFEKMLDKKNLFYKGLEDLSKFRSMMAWSKEQEMKEFLDLFDQGFVHLRDVFQSEMDKKAQELYESGQFTMGSSNKSRLKKY